MSNITDLIESLRYHGEKAECGCTNVNEDLHEAADMIAEQSTLIEQQQREIESLRSRANTWDRVWGELRDTKLIKDIGYEHAKHGNCSAASILLEAFELLSEQVEDEQTSLAEVKAKAIEDACGKVAHEVANSYSGEINGVSDTERAWNDGANQTLRKFCRGFHQHAAKIREGVIDEASV